MREGLSFSRRGRGIGAALAALAFVSSAMAADALFPTPLHLVRRVEDPIAQKATTFDEYCAGNRIVAVNGRYVAITDYERQEITEIDHAAGTYSITRFDEIAKARPARSGAMAKQTAGWKTTPLAVKGSAAGRSLDSYELEAPGSEKHTINVGIDRQVVLSRGAVEALIGASYPNTPSDEQQQLLGVAAPHGQNARVAGDSAASAYGLPAELTITYEGEGAKLVARNSILRVGNELPPADALLIDPGSKRVESPLTRTARELKELDRLPATLSHPRP